MDGEKGLSLVILVNWKVEEGSGRNGLGWAKTGEEELYATLSLTREKTPLISI